MPLVKILQKYENKENWEPGMIVDCTNPWTLIAQNKVALVDEHGNTISRDKSQAQKLIDQLGKEEALLLAFDIMKKFPPEETKTVAPEEVIKEAVAEEVKKEETKTAKK